MQKSFQRPQGQVKVWRPEGCAGLEVEKFDQLPHLELQPFVLQGHELTVAFRDSPTFRLRYRNTPYNLRIQEDLFLMQHLGETVSGVSLEEKPISVWTLRLFPNLMEEVQRSLHMLDQPVYFPAMLAQDVLNASLAGLVRETVQAYDEPTSSLERESRLLRLMHAVFTHCAEVPPRDAKLGREHRSVKKVKEAIRAHPESDVSLDMLSALTGLSKFHLLRVFKREVGVTPHLYQTCLRVHLAKVKLGRGHDLAQIALGLGFADQAHFTRVFKRYTQVTPGQFRNGNREDRTRIPQA